MYVWLNFPNFDLELLKIIERARQNHLFDLFREETKSITPPLLSQVQDAFNLYLRTKVAKGLPESELPIEPGTEEESWTRISSQILDAGWKKAGLAREEKFEMYFQSAVCVSNFDGGTTLFTVRQAKAHQALAAAHAKSSSENDSQAAAHLLIDEARDVLTTSLDAQVRVALLENSTSCVNTHFSTSQPSQIQPSLAILRITGRRNSSTTWQDSTSANPTP
jgi:cysteinyl-tRNA synthetase